MRNALWLALFFGLVWLLIIIWWQTSHRIPTSTDIVLYMLGLPVALVLGYWVLKNSLNAIKLAAANQPAAVQNKNSDGTPAPNNELSGKERAYSLQLVASSLVLVHGNSTSEAIAAIQEGKRPGLDEELIDADGFPVFAGRVADLDTEEFAAEFDPLPAIAEHPIDQWPETIIRSLLMLRKVVEELSNKASEHTDAQQSTQPEQMPTNARKKETPSFTLRVSLVLPEAWPLEIRTWAATWFKVHLDVNKVWNAGPIIVNQISTHSSTAALTLLDQLNLSINREDLRDLCIVASCDSSISQQTADAWSDDGRLFSAKQQNGLVLGEGAAGVLFASKKSAAGFEIETPIEIRRLATARRDKSIDASGKVSTAILEQLSEQALLVSNVEPAKVAAVISDVDQRANRLQEITAVTRKLEAVEPSTDSIALNAACGHVGIASGLICLALSHQLAQDKDSAVLLLCASDAHDRAALTLMPASKELQVSAVAAAS